MLSNSLQRGFADLNVSGLLFNNEESYTFARITACGHTSTHFPHCMHSSSSHTGISLAIFRFSHIAVPVRSEESYTFARITACGHTSTHFPHCMHSSSSHTGISLAIFRFSHIAVPVGNVPSIGNALTGSESPFP